MTIPTREFAKSGIQVGSIGFGAMGLAAFYGDPSPQSTVDSILSTALSAGVNFWDTADIYSPMKSGKLGYNEEQIASFFKSHPEARQKVFLATKFVNRFGKDGSLVMDGSPTWAKQACEDSLKRLGVDQIDLYYAHRPDPKVDVTETVKAMKELKEEGKIKFIGVSEYNLDQLERANKVAHIDAVQIEVSPWTPEALTNGILEWCEKNGTALIPYSPLGRGFLTGSIKSTSDLAEDDFRRFNPRFQGENFNKNLELVEDIRKIAAKKNVTPGQIALAWLLGKSDIILPIPGTTKEKNLKENIDAAEVKLTKEETEEIDSVIKSFKVSGTRYAAEMMKVCAF